MVTDQHELVKRPTTMHHRVLAAVLFWLIPIAVVAVDQELTQALRDALKDVDRIVLEETPASPVSKPGRLMEIKGADLVHELGQAVEIEGRRQHCMCITSPSIKLYAGEQLRFSLTLHHSTRLRDENGPWLGDVEMTESSAEQFRAWFSERGFRGFVERHEAMVLERREYQDRWAALLSLFPDGGSEIPHEDEYLGPKETNRRIEMLRAKFPNATSRIVACWRGLGSLEEWARFQHHPAQRFILRMLKLEETEDLRNALTALADTDGHGWVGAYSHHDSAGQEQKFDDAYGNMLNAVDEDLRSMLVRQKLDHDNDPLAQFTITKLRHHDGPKVRALLVEIAEGRHQGPPTEGKFLGNDYWALHTLAELKDARADAIAAKKLQNTTLERKARLALEVIRAQFDEGIELGMEHLVETDSSVAEAAWSRMKNRVEQWPIESWLTVAAKTSDYDVKQAIEAMLVKRGLRLMKDKERWKQMWSESFERRVDSHENTLRALAEVEAMPAEQGRPNPRAFLLARLRLHEGRHLLKKGDYEAARSSLIQADEEEAADELAIVCLAMGRLDEAMMHARFGGDTAAALVQRAFISFARGDFEQAAMDFDATTRLDRVEVSPVVFAHLAHVLSGHEARSHLPTWESPFGSFVDEDGKISYFWPETGIRYFQGKMTWEEIVASVARMRSETRAEADYALSVMCRIKGDADGEKAHLRSVLETKEYKAQGYLLALIRSRELIK